MWFRKYLPWFFREIVTIFQNVTLCGWNVFTITAENSAVYMCSDHLLTETAHFSEKLATILSGY